MHGFYITDYMETDRTRTVGEALRSACKFTCAFPSADVCSCFPAANSALRFFAASSGVVIGCSYNRAMQASTEDVAVAGVAQTHAHADTGIWRMLVFCSLAASHPADPESRIHSVQKGTSEQQ